MNEPTPWPAPRAASRPQSARGPAARGLSARSAVAGLALVALLLGACTPQGTPRPESTSAPTPAATEPLAPTPSATPTPKDSPTPEATPSPTATEEPSATPTPEVSPSATAGVSPTATIIAPTETATPQSGEIMQRVLAIDGLQVKPVLAKGSAIVPDGTPVWTDTEGKIIYMYDERTDQIMYSSVSPDGKLVWFTDTDMRDGWYDVSHTDPVKIQKLLEAWTGVFRMYYPSNPAQQEPHYNNPNGSKLNMSNRVLVVKLMNAKDWDEYNRNTDGNIDLIQKRGGYDPKMLTQAGIPVPPGLKGVEYRHVMAANVIGHKNQIHFVLEVYPDRTELMIFEPNDGVGEQINPNELAKQDPNNYLDLGLASTAYHISNPKTSGNRFFWFHKESQIGVKRVSPLF